MQITSCHHPRWVWPIHHVFWYDRTNLWQVDMFGTNLSSSELKFIGFVLEKKKFIPFYVVSWNSSNNIISLLWVHFAAYISKHSRFSKFIIGWSLNEFATDTSNINILVYTYRFPPPCRRPEDPCSRCRSCMDSIAFRFGFLQVRCLQICEFTDYLASELDT